MKYKLLCIDIDGTLLDDNKRLLPKTKKCLKDAYSKGVMVALVSGRMPSGVEIVERELEIPCIKVCNAGSYILMGENCIGAAYLPNSVMKELYEKIALEYKIPLWIFCEREWFVTGIDKFIQQEEGVVFYKPQVIDVNCLAERWEKEEKRPNKLLVAAEPDIIEIIYQGMKAQVWKDIDMARSAGMFLEFFPRGVDKGTALNIICKRLNIRTEETIAIGDQELDIPMIEAAGVGIAMGNGIKELKEKADFITKTNNEEGVAYAIEHYLA